jgi:phage antirepressor YoqD-like protein
MEGFINRNTPKWMVYQGKSYENGLFTVGVPPF